MVNENHSDESTDTQPTDDYEMSIFGIPVYGSAKTRSSVFDDMSNDFAVFAEYVYTASIVSLLLLYLPAGLFISAVIAHTTHISVIGTIRPNYGLLDLNYAFDQVVYVISGVMYMIGLGFIIYSIAIVIPIIGDSGYVIDVATIDMLSNLGDIHQSVVDTITSK